MSRDPAADDRYELRERLGEGAMGVVWAAHDRALDRTVAMKVMSEGFLDAAHQERLAAEARAMARLSHPNVVAIYDVGEREGRAYLTMELVRGVDLGRWLETPREAGAILDVFRAVARGLAAAHAAGVVHRDIKPGNILIGDDGEVRVADFGVAHAGSRPVAVDGAAAPSSRTTGLIGSPAYMSPEQLRGEPATARGDQFAFFVSLYEALHARRPFDGETITDLVAAIEAGPPPPVREVPRWLSAAVARGLSADPDARFPSMTEVGRALAGPRARRPWIAAAAAAMLLAGGGVAALALAGGRDGASACAAVDRELDGIWDDAARGRIAAGFATLDRSWAAAAAAGVTAAIDRYATDWTAARRRACEGARARGEAAMVRHVRCLDDRRRSLHQLARALATPDLGVADKVADLVSGLPRVADCEHPAYLDGIASIDVTLSALEDLSLARVHRLAGHEDQVVPILARVIEAAVAAGDRGLEAEALHLRGLVESKLGETGAAIESYRAAAEAAAEAGATSVGVDVWIALSHAQQRLGRFAEAGEVLELAEAALRAEPDPYREAQLLEAQGTLLGRRGRYAEALPRFERGQAILVEMHGPDSPQLVPGHTNLSIVYRHADRHEDAMAQLRRAVEIQRVYGDEHPRVGRARHSLAALIGRFGKYDEAVVEFEAAERILRAALGERHKDVASVLQARAAFLHENDAIDAAVNYYRRALAIQEELEPGGPVTLTTKSNLASALTDLGQLDEAEALMREVLPSRIATVGENHPDVAAVHTQLGKMQMKRTRLDDAWASLQAARRILTTVYGAEHSAVATSLSHLASIERKRKAYRRALDLDAEALRIRRATLPAGHAEIADSLQWTVEDLRLVGQPGRAVPLAEELVETHRGNDRSVDATVAELFLARVLWESGKDRARARELARVSHAELLPYRPLGGNLAHWSVEAEALLEVMGSGESAGTRGARRSPPAP